MSILPLLYEDVPALAALQPPDWSEMTPHLYYYIRTPYCHPIKVVIDNEIAGIGTTILHHDSAWLAHVIVHPQHRNKGLGKIITQHLVKSVDAAHNNPIYLVATELGYPVYTQVGFEVEAMYLHLKREAGVLAGTTSTNIVPYQEKYRNDILALDKAMSGETRDDKLNEGLEEAMVYVTDGKVSGAYFPTLGDGFIVAANPTAGIELMRLRLQTNTEATVPVANQLAIDFLKANGFKEFRPMRRMVLGTPRPWQASMMYNRISGQVG